MVLVDIDTWRKSILWRENQENVNSPLSILQKEGLCILPGFLDTLDVDELLKMRFDEKSGSSISGGLLMKKIVNLPKI